MHGIRCQIKLSRPSNDTVYHGHLTKQCMVSQVCEDASKSRWFKSDDSFNSVLKPHPKSMSILHLHIDDIPFHTYYSNGKIG